VADDLEVVRRESLDFRRGQFDNFDRHPRIVEEGQTVIAGGGLLRCQTSRVGRDRALSGRRRGDLILGNRLAQTHLAIGAVDDPSFALLAEELTLEPGDLMFGRRQLAAQANDLMRAVQSISRVVARRQSDRNLPCSSRFDHTQKPVRSQ
jgi:hypothetical protein